jgi:hypothetical protein
MSTAGQLRWAKTSSEMLVVAARCTRVVHIPTRKVGGTAPIPPDNDVHVYFNNFRWGDRSGSSGRTEVDCPWEDSYWDDV